MDNTNRVEKGRVRLYACGGCGINIGAMFEKHRGQIEDGFAELDIVYVDTSKSNLSRNIDPEHCYLIKGLDGSGKLRHENHVEIEECVRAILQEFQPADLNIVLSSAAGGSGSVIAPLITREFLSQDIPTIVLTIGSGDTRLDINNTLKTLKSYESISKKTGTPVVMSYMRNSINTPRKVVDNKFYSIILALCVLYSRENNELDSMDLFNWLHYDRVTTFPVQLNALTILDSNNPLKGSSNELGNVISVATVGIEHHDGSTLAMVPEYQCVGFLPANANKDVMGSGTMHYVISDGILHEEALFLSAALSNMDKAVKARIPKASVLGHGDDAHESGLVL